MSSFFRKLAWLIQRRKREAEFREELQFHLDEEAQERTREGCREEEALRAARREFGNVTAVQESARAVWGWTFLEQVVQDLRYALRAMLRNRAFTALAVLSLALGIGANTAIYSFMDAVLWRVLPVADPASLALLNWHSQTPRGIRPNHVMHSMDGSTWGVAGTGVTSGIFPYGAFELFQRDPSLFSSLFADCTAGGHNLAVQGQADDLFGAVQNEIREASFGDIELAPDAMYAEIANQRREPQQAKPPTSRR